MIRRKWSIVLLKYRGFTLRDPYTGDESIILNARMTHEANVKAYAHEIYHKLIGDLDSDEDINTIENRAHRAALEE